jgi:DNA-binding NtrC family response regulator
VKVVVSSGHCPPEQVILLESLGVKRFLDKPYTAVKLLKILRDALSESAPMGTS